MTPITSSSLPAQWQLVSAHDALPLDAAWIVRGEGEWEILPDVFPPHKELVFTLRTGWQASECRVHHPALVRLVGRSVVGGDEDWHQGWHSPLTQDMHFAEPVGAPGFGIYPPIVVFGPDGTGWLTGPTSEVASRCLWEWGSDHTGELVVTARLVPWGVQGDTRPRRGEGWFLKQFEGGLSPELFDSYNDAIGRQLDPTPAQRNPDVGLTWATWNDGVFRDIDHDRIDAMCTWLAQELPQVRWVQADDGWAGPAATIDNEDGTLGMSDFGVFYRPERLDGDARFPGGMKAVADMIRSHGFRPALWLTPAVMAGQPLYLEKPEWFLTEARLNWMPEMRFLDFSRADVREFVQDALDLVFKEWGFEGTKLDFWTMTFEETNVRLSEDGPTAVEWMDWFLEQIRRRIPSDGLVLHCIGLPFGGPWRSKWCDHFRYYADSEGSCGVQEMVREQAVWAAYIAGLYGLTRFWGMNGDGFGLFDHIHLPADEHRRWAAFMLGSGSTTELSGWLYRKSDHPGVPIIKTVAGHATFGSRIELPGYDYASEPVLPPAVWVRHDRDGGHLVGVCNWTDSAVEIEIPGEGPYRCVLTGRHTAGGQAVTVAARDGLALVPA